MTIRRKLQILASVTFLGLGLIMFATISGMNSMQEAESTALRREGYSLLLVEIKASAISTIMLDPTLKETRDVFAEAEKNISDLQTKVQSIIRRPALRDEFTKTMAQWAQYDQESQRLIKLAGSNTALANEQLVPLYNTLFKPFQAQLEKFVSERLSEARAGRAEAERCGACILDHGLRDQRRRSDQYRITAGRFTFTAEQPGQHPEQDIPPAPGPPERTTAQPKRGRAEPDCLGCQ
jgi:hypothetical protein